MYCITVYSGTVVLQYALLRCYLCTLCYSTRSVLFYSAVRDYSDTVHYACSLTAMLCVLLLLQAITEMQSQGWRGISDILAVQDYDISLESSCCLLPSLAELDLKVKIKHTIKLK